MKLRNLRRWRRSDVDVGQLWQDPEGLIYSVISIADEPTVTLTYGGSTVHHVIGSSLFAAWKRLDASSPGGAS